MLSDAKVASMTYQLAIQSACDILGSQSALAKALELAPALIHQWRAGIRPVPVQHCVAIERVTGGAVSRRELRPDDWHLIWPELADQGTPATAGEVSHG